MDNGDRHAPPRRVADVTARVAIDPNVRLRGNQTYSGLEDVEGPVTVGDAVLVYEPECGLRGPGRVTEVDLRLGLIYLSVDWSSCYIEKPA